jgi:hypothetical protein
MQIIKYDFLIGRFLSNSLPRILYPNLALGGVPPLYGSGASAVILINTASAFSAPF